MSDSNDDSRRWWGFVSLLVTFCVLLVPAGCDNKDDTDSDSPATRTTHLAVPGHSAAPALDIWISIAETDDSAGNASLDALPVPTLGNIAYLPLRDCLGQQSHDWPTSHAVTTEFDLHNGKIQRGVADYVEVNDLDPKNWPLPDDSLDKDPTFVSCVTKRLGGPMPDDLDLPASTHLQVRVGLRPSGQ
jgi:hypothetical protein